MTNVLKTLDEEVLRCYTKLGTKMKSIFPTCYTGIGLACLSTATAVKLHYFQMSYLFPIEIFIGADFSRTNLELMYKHHNNNVATSEAIEFIGPDTPFAYISKKTSKYTRCPLFLTSIGLGIKGLINTYNILENNPADNPILDFQVALGALGLASSMYLKDRNQKLLQRDSLLVQAYKKAKEKVGLLAPQPVPVPVRANYSTLEDVI